MDLRKLGFSVWESCSMKDPAAADLETRLPKAIARCSGWKYTCTPTPEGYLLEPTFRDDPYRNSFVPEISLVASQINGQPAWMMKGRPVMFIRIFMGIWFGGLFRMELLLILIALFSEIALFPLLIPVMMCAFGYLLCKIVTNRTFRAVAKAIQTEVSLQ
jgi:hypothetical protein